jgi:hypothetical protein
VLTDDLALVKEMFSVISAGIFTDYDFFDFDVDAGDGYIDYGVVLHKDGVKINNAKMDIDEDTLSDLIKKLRASAESRGEPWESFVMSYQRGEQVKTTFTYGEN